MHSPPSSDRNGSLTSTGADRIPPPSHRHAAPSAPWPWIDIRDTVDQVQLANQESPIPEHCDHKNKDTCNGCWVHYPQSLFPNWTEYQVKRSKIYDAIHNYPQGRDCKIRYVDVNSEGLFTDAGEFTANDQNNEATWDWIVHDQASEGNRVRALFIEDMSGPVLQMLGAKYNIEPFFFSSSLNWIPSRFQEEVRPNEGDHITITMTFLRSMPANADAIRMSARSPYSAMSSNSVSHEAQLEYQEALANQMIDTQAPLELGTGGRLLVLDLLSVHLVRRKTGSVIISLHPSLNLPTTTAKYLHERIRFAGQSVYWQKIFERSDDPTFVLLTYIWHALYAWDEALENLYTHICNLETHVINTSEMNLTQELHIIRAHHLHYASLLDDFKKTVEFIRDTVNPALDDLSDEEKEAHRKIMGAETTNLLSEIERLEKGRQMQDRRLKNVMNLVFSSVNILDSKRMQKMTEAAVRDSAAMKQIAYLTMVFLPASFVATIFGMNVKEIVPETSETLPHYFETAAPLTLATVWIIVAFQSKYILGYEMPFWKRLGWPILMPLKRLGWGPYKQQELDDDVPGVGVECPDDDDRKLDMKDM
ncbi:hypothetical protein CC1G_06925 [Coprinopsis cinerea okayama7|uniref:Uncharacterized protein n=1 Tax=Coprinopsis cinerea (strain Okayama-7 / 130 / ATCC MYA-4618 / FGSC 9003) TaxID=240176 RepID=A8NZP8_COPC7|nr:hypothetical protein CC1G_06925 [Coprinopsis cinerea okayama7\|eukprot:XP_001837719.2 hypothetical protein CC1G_06925 [Coprinopsis cinerea okayama7\